MLFFEVVTWLMLGLMLGTARWYLAPAMSAAGPPMTNAMAGALVGGAIGRIISPADLGAFSVLALMCAGLGATLLLTAVWVAARKEWRCLPKP
jgi:hypothetical protein